MKEKIIRIEKGKEGIAIPEEYLRFLELIPGAEVELTLDKEKKLIIIKPLKGDEFLGHFKETMDTMA